MCKHILCLVLKINLMKKEDIAVLLLQNLCSKRSKTIRVGNDIIKYLCHKGYIEAVCKVMEKKSGHPCSVKIRDKDKRKICIYNTDPLITKGTLVDRWSKRLVERYFSEPTMEMDNPHYSSSAPMCLYAMSEVKRIEARKDFKAEFNKLKRYKLKKHRREVIRKMARILGIAIKK